ncbi:hypothetical protein ABB37_01994 [Leptomonas pyrrhocoris]|uniref:Cysteamine dioxygenase n=1 Tax=Leptomonas pyrrhocoris TaxID=157538 RepID=A0A0N0DYA3_LEPPY|nr:hypothetical protein ABB37_01994 [Leptomonas pyrrhocoris]KPA83762.1 hypothetical protein ABB37_01994 [Leptomonas pyrrhocoris]|eukprot:XP_015662201.1 hypothetical protein ABB37_01994 [Leptomonas pyrrhocoris]
MRSLLRSLQQFSKTSTEHVELFSKLALKDLGVYVKDTDVVRYTQDNTYPLDDKAFWLKNALLQCRYNSATSRFVPHAWMSSPADPLGCSTLFQDEQVTLCWFVIPPGRVLPLHDHPGMTVWQRVMHGRLHICTFVSDASPLEIKTAEATQATVVFDGDVDGVGEAIPPPQLITFGEGDGSVFHEIRNTEAVRPALFIDIISPPYYQPPTNIPCAYYRAEPVSQNVQRLEGQPSDCGVHWTFKPGDKALLHPRPEYGGPSMHAYVNVDGS